jgi:hypothetical protein
MKKIFTFLALSVIALTTFTSCDRDAYEANTLNGQWSGYISAYYVDRWGLVGSDYRTTINFAQRDTYGGTGYEVDYDLNDPYGSYYYSPIEWEVNRGVIRIYYPYDDYYVEIYDYQLNSSYFRGFMDDGTRRDIEFSLAYDGNFNWDPYRGGSYWGRRAAGADDDTAVNGERVARGAFAKVLNAQSAAE